MSDFDTPSFFYGIILIIGLYMIYGIYKCCKGNRVGKTATNNVRQSWHRTRGRKLFTMIDDEQKGSVISMITKDTSETSPFSSEVFKRFQTFFRQCGNTDDIDIVIHTSGGNANMALAMAEIIHSHPGNVRCYIPNYAMSAGTIIALACNEVILGRNAFIGPIDVQISQNIMMGTASYPALARLTREKPAERIEDVTFLSCYSGETYTQNFRRLYERILLKNYTQDEVGHVLDYLSMGDKPHGFMISCRTARENGIKLSEQEIPAEVYAMIPVIQTV